MLIKQISLSFFCYSQFSRSRCRYSQLKKEKKKLLYNYSDDSNSLTLGKKAQAENVFMTGKVTSPRLQPNE